MRSFYSGNYKETVQEYNQRQLRKQDAIGRDALRNRTPASLQMRVYAAQVVDEMKKRHEFYEQNDAPATVADRTFYVPESMVDIEYLEKMLIEYHIAFKKKPKKVYGPKGTYLEYVMG